VSTEVRFPKIGFSMSEGTLSEWMVVDGAAVVEGQAIYSFENGKAIEEVTAPASGRLRILGKVGLVYKVGDLIGSIE
jgi:pyruvate/2-oxoglutarate dehydrogenase complex dihydrolipoamide acyltransferase (E2) component